MVESAMLSCIFFFNDPATTEIYTLSLHDALPIYAGVAGIAGIVLEHHEPNGREGRSEEHTSELQSRRELVCRLLLEKKKTRVGDVLAMLSEIAGIEVEASIDPAMLRAEEQRLVVA